MRTGSARRTATGTAPISWRNGERWAEHVNTRLAELDIDARVDHRSLEAQGIALEPQHKIGPAASRMSAQGLESERLAEHVEIARDNGERIIANPSIALDAITQNQATFTRRDFAMFAHRHSDGLEQFDRIRAAVNASPDLIRLGKDGRGEQRFTSRDMLESEQRLERATDTLSRGGRYAVEDGYRDAAVARAEARGMMLSSEQRSALDHVTAARRLGIVVGYAGTGKSAMLGVAREAWEAAGYQVHGAALSGIAAENLESGSGIASRTVASLEHQWEQGRELLDQHSVLVIDEAGMIGTRQMERVVSECEKRGAKIVLVGDPEQLQAIEAGAAFRSTAERYGSVEISQVRRQREDWQRDATRELATGRTAEAVAAYDGHGSVHAAPTRDEARADLIDRWDGDRAGKPDATHIILTHTNDEVHALNLAARNRLRGRGELSDDFAIQTERGARHFARGDRIVFLRNERDLGVKNGTLGTVQSITQSRMAVMLDDRRSVAFDVKDYAQIDHGYAATVHKAQGMTVDRVHVLATPGLDRHAAYVALSRHRDRVDLHYGGDDFADRGNLVRALSRERGKDMASDYPAPVQPRPIEPPAPAPAQPDHEGRAARRLAVVSHAEAVDSIFASHRKGQAITPAQDQALKTARDGLGQIGEYVSLDLESAYKRDPVLAAEAAFGRVGRVNQAMQLEAEIRKNPTLRADRFVTRWNALSAGSERAHVAGDVQREKAIRNEMAGMAKSLERDPQMESLLVNRKAQLGLTFDSGRKIGAELALNYGIDIGRTRGLGI